MSREYPYADIFRGFRGELLENEPLRLHTSLNVGGTVDRFAVPAGRDELLRLLDDLVARQVPYLILGGGYNLLVRDGGFRGVAISLGQLTSMERLSGDRVRVEAGAVNHGLVRFCRGELLTGLEFLGMIPGTVGGAIAVNAGAHGAAVMERLCRLESWLHGAIRSWDSEERVYGYRWHALEPGEVILVAEFSLEPGDPRVMDETVAEYRNHRRESQQVTLPSAGSFFKNPPGEPAWRLIDRAGLRGCRIGGAQVAEAHTNFLVNAGSATARDFLQLAALIKERVREMSGIQLEEEVRIVGVDGDEQARGSGNEERDDL